jgi:hypothetical protein
MRMIGGSLHSKIVVTFVVNLLLVVQAPIPSNAVRGALCPELPVSR